MTFKTNKTLRAAALATVAGLGLLALRATAAQDQAPTTQPTDNTMTSDAGFQTTDTGLRYKVVQPAGDPMSAQDGDVVMVHYTGKLEDGTVFDTSLRPRSQGRVTQVEPFVFTLGKGLVIPGWEQGIKGMKVGEKRQLVIPPNLAYGEKGAGGVIPPNATLVFDVQLVGLWRPEPAAEKAPE